MVESDGANLSLPPLPPPSTPSTSSALTSPALFPTILCRLPNIIHFSLYNNSINSTLPPSLSPRQNLEHLDLSQNLLTSALLDLKYLDLTKNNFSRPIFDSFSRFQKLEVFYLIYNLIESTIPPFLNNISTLKMLNLSYNSFHSGRILAELGNLTNLEVLWLTECNLVGEIPDSLGRLKNLKDLDLAINGF